MATASEHAGPSDGPLPEVTPARWPDLADQDVQPAEPAERLRRIQLLAVIALVFGACYLAWRVIVTTSGASWWLAWPLVLLEMHSLCTFLLYMHVLWHPGYLRPPAPIQETASRVAILIPTFNESPDVLLPTVAAAAVLPQADAVWILDDGDRDWVKDMAAELGVRYRARPTHEHAKAGNINAVLSELDCDYVAVLDADHVVRADFLANVLGYFEDPRVALVQTPQSFYNTDSFEHMVSPSGQRYCEQDLFYRLLAEARNRWGAALWCGTNAVVRLDALKDVGGIATHTVTEDIETTIRMHRSGYRTIYHNEVLARGLAASNSEQYLDQRLRWGTGAMQVLRVDNPLVEPSFDWHKKLSYASTLLGWFDSWRTLGFILLPMATLLTGGLPVAAPAITFLIFFAVSWVLQRVATQLLARGRAALWPSTVFEFIRLPASLKATTALLSARPRPFTVTDNGRTGAERRRMRLPHLLVVLIAGSIVCALWYVATIAGYTPVTYRIPWVAHASVAWLTVNASFLAAALVRIRSESFAGERRTAIRFRASGIVTVNDQPTAEVQDVSLTGLQLTTSGNLPVGRRVSVDISPLMNEPVAAVVQSTREGLHDNRVGLRFVDLTIWDRAHLALRLFQTGVQPALRPAMTSASDATDAATEATLVAAEQLLDPSA